MGKSTRGNGCKVKSKAAKKSPFSSSNKGAGGGSGAQKILDFTHYFETRTGNKDVSRKQVAPLSGVKSNTFPVTLSGMKKKGWIEYDKDSIRLTEEGRARANPVSELPAMDNASAQQEIKNRFKIGGKAEILFDALTDGEVHDRASVVDGLGYKSKNASSVMLSGLKKNGIIEIDKTTIRLTDICFPFGRFGLFEELEIHI